MGEAHKGSPAPRSCLGLLLGGENGFEDEKGLKTGLAPVRQSPGVTKKVVDPQKSLRLRPGSYLPNNATFITLLFS